jgi:hypothetical protein
MMAAALGKAVTAKELVAMSARRQPDVRLGFGFFLAVALVIGVIIKYIWWIVGAAALVGAFFAVRAIVRHVEQRRVEAAERDAALARRAEQQHRWTLRGDSRGVYGPSGAQAMRSVSSTPPDLSASEPTEVAAVTYNAENLDELIRLKPPCWRWAAFASVLVQRRESLQARLRDSALGFTTSTGRRLYSGAEVKNFVIDRMDELSQLVAQVESFMLAPAFVGMFGDPDDEGTADAAGILHIANRLMDYLERFLELSEVCRGASAPSQYADLMRDCARLADAPLEGYRTFIDEFVARVGEMAELLRYAKGAVEVEPVVLEMDVDDQLLRRITRGVKALRAS